MIIKIKNLRLKAWVGVYEWEKKQAREVIVNAEIVTGHRKSMKSDDLADAIDYDVIINKIKDHVQNHHYQLIERMLEEVLDLIMQDSRILQCKLEIDKPKVHDFLDSFSVTDTRKNNG